MYFVIKKKHVFSWLIGLAFAVRLSIFFHFHVQFRVSIFVSMGHGVGTASN